MSHPERNPHNLELVCRAYDRLAKIASIKYPPISDNARWVSQMLERELYVIDVIDPEKQLVQPWVMDFQVKDVPTTGLPEGVIVLDPYRMSSASDEAIDSELVRTVSVAVQYPGRGFNRPLRLVYNEAVDMQKVWLEANHVRGALLDPRIYDRKVLLKNILGPHVYYADFGYTHWKDALAKMESDKDHEGDPEAAERNRVIAELMNDHNAFVLWRARMTPDREHNRSMAEILEQRFEQSSFEVLAAKNALHAASNAVRERIE